MGEEAHCAAPGCASAQRSVARAQHPRIGLCGRGYKASPLRAPGKVCSNCVRNIVLRGTGCSPCRGVCLYVRTSPIRLERGVSKGAQGAIHRNENIPHGDECAGREDNDGARKRRDVYRYARERVCVGVACRGEVLPVIPLAGAVHGCACGR